jgi:hypothetical protein
MKLVILSITGEDANGSPLSKASESDFNARRSHLACNCLQQQFARACNSSLRQQQ